jgi:hypothetical protein
MVTREQLASSGLRAYELGRLRAAARIAVYLVPVALLCVLETREREHCACLGVLLLAGSIWLRWRNRRGMENVTTGLLAGSVPMFASLALGRLFPMCHSAGLLSACTAVLVATGACAGIWIGLRGTRSRAELASVGVATGIALLTGSLGCIGLGMSSLFAVAAGVLLGEVSATLVLRSAR